MELDQELNVYTCKHFPETVMGKSKYSLPLHLPLKQFSEAEKGNRFLKWKKFEIYFLLSEATALSVGYVNQ